MKTLMKAAIFIMALTTTLPVFSLDYYWVGGTGNWNDLTHWATTTGGSTKHTVIPSSIDDVFFDDKSFTGTGQIVTINVNPAQCNNMNWSNALYNPTFNTNSSSNELKIYGSLTLISGMTFSHNGYTYFQSTTTGKTITMGGKSFLNRVILNGIGGGWTFQDAFSSTDIILHNYGSLNTNNQTVTMRAYSSNNGNTRSLTLGSSLIVLSNDGSAWEFQLSNFTFNAGTSTIRYTGANGSFNCTSSPSNVTFNNFEFPCSNQGRINNSTGRIFYFNNVSFSSNGVITGTNTFNGALSFTAGKTYTLPAGSTQTIGATGSFTATGNCAAIVTIQSSASGSQATLNKTSGTTNLYYLILKDLNATGGATWNANYASATNCTGWNVTPLPNAGLPYYWIGGSGSWNDASHWSLSSGGPPNASGCIPDNSNDVFFDDKSFSASGQTVTMNINPTACKSMSWTGALYNPSFNTTSSSNELKIYGSLTLINAMNFNHNGYSYFEATSTGKTITLGGKSFLNRVILNGNGGGWTLQDAFTSTDIILHNYGSLNTNGQTVTMRAYSSNNGNTRSLTLGSSLFVLSNDGSAWEFQLSNFTFNAGTSTIRYTGANGSFNCTSSPSNVTFNNFEFPCSNQGRINNSTGRIFYFNNVSFSSNGVISGNNTYNGTLSLAAGKTYTLPAGNTQTIDAAGNISANGNCFNIITIQSSSAGTQATFSKSGASINVDFVYLKDNNATGGAVWNATNSSGSNATGWNITGLSNSGLPYYWISGTGNWNDPAHWSLSSGGPPNVSGCIPDATNDVFFDVNSFPNPSSKTVTVNIANALCKSMSWTGALNNPVFTTSSSSNNLKIYGSLILISGMTFSYNGYTYFEATSTGMTITTDGKSFSNRIFLNGNGGGWTLQDAFNSTEIILHNYGSFNTNNQTVNIVGYSSKNGNTRSLLLGSSLFIVSANGQGFEFDMQNMTFDAGTSTIRFPNNFGVLYCGTSSSNVTFYDVEFSCATLGRIDNQTGRSLIFNNVPFAGSGAINGNNTFNGDLSFTAGSTYTFQSGTTQTLSGDWILSGLCTNFIILQSSSTGNAANISKTSGYIDGYYLNIKDITATGGATFEAFNSVNMGGNSGWTFSSLPPLGNPGAISGSASMCPGQTGINYYIAPVAGALSYSWTVPAGSVITSGQGDTLIAMSAGASSGNVTVTAFNGCAYSAPSTLAVTIYPYPAAFSITGGGSYCSETSSPPVGLSGSEAGVNYQLLYAGNPLWSPINGTGSGISFGNQTQAGTYTAEGTNAAGCKTTMTGSVGVSIYNCPASYPSAAINTAGAMADTAAVLDISDTISGILLPRLTSAERDALNTPDIGLLIYNTTTNKITYYNASGWNEINSSSLGVGAGSTAITYGTAINASGAIPAPSAILDVESSTKGMLIPRTLPGAIYGAKEGSIIYNIHTGKISYYTGATWTGLTAAVASTTIGGGSQSVSGTSVNTTNANPASSAVLDVSAQNKAFILPRLTDTQRNRIAPATGLIIYNTTSNEIQYFTGGWHKLQ